MLRILLGNEGKTPFNPCHLENTKEILDIIVIINYGYNLFQLYTLFFSEEVNGF